MSGRQPVGQGIGKGGSKGLPKQLGMPAGSNDPDYVPIPKS